MGLNNVGSRAIFCTMDGLNRMVECVVRLTHRVITVRVRAEANSTSGCFEDLYLEERK